MTVGLTYSASLGKFLPGPGSGGGSYNIAPLKYLALGSLLTATANSANIATAKAMFPEIALPFSNFVGTIGQMLRPYPQYGTINTPMFTVGQSNYQGLQATFNRRFANGFTFTAGYTFSKQMDNLLAAARDPFDYSLEKSRGGIDHRHVFTATSTFQLPFGAGHTLNPGNPVVRAVISRWTVSGLVTFATGSPLALTGTACNAGGILGTCIPNYNPAWSGKRPHQRRLRERQPHWRHGNLVLGPDRVRRPRGIYLRQLAQDRSLRPQCAVQLIHRHERAPRVRDSRKHQARHPGRCLQREQYRPLRNARDSTRTRPAFGTITSQVNQPRKLQLNARITF